MGSKKNNDVVIFLASSEIRQCKILTSCQKIHRPSVNRFDGIILWYGFDYKSKSEDDTTKS